MPNPAAPSIRDEQVRITMRAAAQQGAISYDTAVREWLAQGYTAQEILQQTSAQFMSGNSPFTQMRAACRAGATAATASIVAQDMVDRQTGGDDSVMGTWLSTGGSDVCDGCAHEHGKRMSAGEFKRKHGTHQCGRRCYCYWRRGAVGKGTEPAALADLLKSYPEWLYGQAIMTPAGPRKLGADFVGKFTPPPEPPPPPEPKPAPQPKPPRKPRKRRTAAERREAKAARDLKAAEQQGHSPQVDMDKVDKWMKDNAELKALVQRQEAFGPAALTPQELQRVDRAQAELMGLLRRHSGKYSPAKYQVHSAAVSPNSAAVATWKDSARFEEVFQLMDERVAQHFSKNVTFNLEKDSVLAAKKAGGDFSYSGLLLRIRSSYPVFYKKFTAEITWHELGHGVAGYYGSTAAEIEWLKNGQSYKTGPVQITDALPEWKAINNGRNTPTGYGRRVYETDDAWSTAPAGSVELYAAEVVSTGMEALARNPITFALSYPEHFKFTVGVLNKNGAVPLPQSASYTIQKKP